MSNKYNKSLLEDPISFAQKHFMYCGVDPGYTYKVRNYYMSVPSGNRICYWNITEEYEKTGSPICYVQISKEPAENYFCGYYLPWAENQIIKCTLKDKRVKKEDSLEGGANAFFTYVVDGCSIFVEGPLDQPTVYHANNLHGLDYESSDKKHRSFIAKDLEIKWGQIKFPKSSDIVFEKSQNQFEVPSGKALHAKQYLADEKKLKKEHSEQYIKIFGMVFGVRTNEKWQFFIQKYMRITSKKTGLLSFKLMDVQEFWPGGQLGIVVFRSRSTHQLDMEKF